jgi:hypothetical protein
VLLLFLPSFLLLDDFLLVSAQAVSAAGAFILRVVDQVEEELLYILACLGRYLEVWQSEFGCLFLAVFGGYLSILQVYFVAD